MITDKEAEFWRGELAWRGSGIGTLARGKTRKFVLDLLDDREERIKENARLREALKEMIAVFDSWMPVDEDFTHVEGKAIERARAALEEKDES